MLAWIMPNRQEDAEGKDLSHCHESHELGVRSGTSPYAATEGAVYPYSWTRLAPCKGGYV